MEHEGWSEHLSKANAVSRTSSDRMEVGQLVVFVSLHENVFCASLQALRGSDRLLPIFPSKFLFVYFVVPRFRCERELLSHVMEVLIGLLGESSRFKIE